MDENTEYTTEQTETEEIVEQDTGQEEQQTQETTVTENEYMYIQSDQLELTNHLISGQIFFMGLIFGVLLFKIFWDRWKV